MSFFRIDDFKAVRNDYFKNVFFLSGLYSLVALFYAFTIFSFAQCIVSPIKHFAFPEHVLFLRNVLFYEKFLDFLSLLFE